MANNFQRREIGKDIYFSRITDSRFKTNGIFIAFLSPLSEEIASENAVVSRYISKLNKKNPTYTSMNNMLSAMYCAKLCGSVSSMGDTQGIIFSINYIDSKYALNGENMDSEAVEVLADCLFNPLAENKKFDENILSLEKQSVIDDIESEINDKQAYASQKAYEIMFRNEPYAFRALGTVEGVKRVTPESAYRAYLRILHHCRIEIICSGTSDFEEVKKKLTSLFTKLPRDEIFSCKTRRSPLKPAPETVEEKMDVTQSKMILGFKTDCDNLSALFVMNEIFGGTPTSKLFENVREKMSLCYNCHSSINWIKGAAFVSCGVEKGNIKKAYNEILNQLKSIQKGEFTEEDVVNAKMYRKNYLKAYNDSLNAIAAWYMSRIYCDSIATPEEWAERTEKVTKEEIIKAANSLKLDTFYVLSSDEEKSEQK